MPALLFDFGGTLDGPSHWLDRFLTHYAIAGIRLTRTQFDPAFSYATRKAYENHHQLRKFCLDELVNYLVAQQLEFLGDAVVPGTPGPAARSSLSGVLVSKFVAETRAGLAESVSLIRALALNHRIGIVSNFYGNLDVILHEAGFPETIAVADSSALQLFKPDLAIYRAALALVSGTPSTTLMIGDSLSKDCAPAQALGMKAVWLRHPATPTRPADAEVNADFTIHRLRELPELLCSLA